MVHSKRVCVVPIFTHLQDAPDPLSYLITRWSTDPVAEGSYAHLKAGLTDLEYEAMAAPLASKVYFAGEYLSNAFRGCTHGAYASGKEVASQILRFL